jgi:hypothetical protein
MSFASYCELIMHLQSIQDRVEAEISVGHENPVNEKFSSEEMMQWKSLSKDERRTLMDEEYTALEAQAENLLLLEAAIKIAKRKAAQLSAESDPANNIQSAAELQHLSKDELERNLEGFKAENERDMIQLRELAMSNLDRYFCIGILSADIFYVYICHHPPTETRFGLKNDS